MDCAQPSHCSAPKRRGSAKIKGNGTNDEPSTGPAMETRVVAAITLKSPRPVMTLTRPKDLTAAQLAAEPRSNPSINDVTRSGRIYQPAQLRGPVAVAPEIPPPARRAEVAESYDVAQHLKRIPAQISIFDLLQTSPLHRDAFSKVLQNTHVSSSTPPDDLQAIIGLVTAPQPITFTHFHLESKFHMWSPYTSRFIRMDLRSTKWCLLIDNRAGLNVYKRLLKDLWFSGYTGGELSTPRKPAGHHDT